ncbi:MAG: TIGR03617 family F420-dependent LLM class oxidoreductase [Actinomycetota bacterium]|nr:TIGR03617 family F420-dependent LLM class oxidoreductase [Actinomycetota bacterium]
MKIDSYLPPDSLAEAGRMAAWAEQLGFAGIFSAETSHDPFLPLLEAARETQRCTLGTAIAVAFARSPTELAHTAWDLAAYSSGRFLLGLGSQVRAHVTRRFSMPWSHPGPRLREYILALRAIWDTWQTGSPLRFSGDYYQLTLMTPFFDPGPIQHPEVPVYIAGVGPYMCRLAGELCQGLHVHPLHTIRYLDELVLPNLAAGAERAGRRLQDVERAATIFAVTGRDEEEMAAAARAVKQHIAFYASTPSYSAVLELHGWDFGPTLTAMSRRGEWASMGEVIPDEVLEEVAVRAHWEELGHRLQERYGDRIQRAGLYLVGLEPSDEQWSAILASAAGP